MQFRILGPMEVVDNEGPVGLGGTKQRATLGFLLLQANRVVATSQLLNALWGVDDAPITARKILQNAVYGLRGVLSTGNAGKDPFSRGTATLLTQPPGYMMRVDPEQVDLHLFRKWVGEGREKQAQGAAEPAALLLRDALALWRGPALADLVEAGIDWPELVAVQSARLDVMEDYFDAQLACGRHQTVLAELETMVQAEPLRERSCGQLMLALYRCGRQADALNVFSRIRAALVENLGLEPGSSLKRLQQAILTHDAELAPDRQATGGPLTTAGNDMVRESIRVAAPPVARTDVVHHAVRGSRTEASGGETRAPQPAPDRRRVGVVSIRTRLIPAGSGREDFDDVLDHAASVVKEQIERFGGTVTASIGSVSLALFGLHGPGDDDPRRAVLAALAVRDLLDVSGGPGAARLTVQAAVTTGEVLLRRRSDEDAPTVVGAVLDESQALLSEVPAGEVRASDEVRRATEDAISYRFTDAPSAGWEAMAAYEDHGDFAAQDSGRPFELDVLRGLAERTRHRAVPYLVTVLGEAGTGKSRLLGDFEHWVGGRPDAPVVLTGRTPAPTHNNSLVAQAQILSAYCGIRPGDATVTVRATLADRVRSLFPSSGAAEPMLSRLLPLLSTGAEALLGVVCPEEVLGAWCEFFQEAARRGPVVMCIDDLHHAADFVLDAVEELAASAGQRPLFVAVCARPELLRRRPGWAGGKSHATTVTLDRPEAVTDRRLVESLASAAHSESTRSFSR